MEKNSKACSVYLRALELDDFRTTINWRKDDEIWQGVLGEKYFVSSEYEKQWVADAIKSKNEIKLGVCVKETDELIGLASIVAMDLINRSARSQILIGQKDCWGKGFGSQAVELLLGFAFLERGLERMWVRILETNKASIALHEKIGYQREGVMRKAAYKNGKFQNVVVLSLLREEFDALHR